MGGSSSTEVFDYRGQLEADTVPQSTELKETREKSGPIYVDIAIKDGKLLSTPAFDEKCVTIYDLFQRGLRIGPDNNCIGTRAFTVEDGKYKRGEYLWESYSDIYNDAFNYGKGLVALGAKAKDNIGIFSINNAEWVKLQQGIYSQNMRVVSLYATLGKDACEYITKHAELAIVACSLDNLPGMMDIIEDCSTNADGGFLTHIIVFDHNEKYGNSLDVVTQQQRDDAKAQGITIVTLSELHKLGSESTIEANPPTTEDLAFIMYTSGTTGQPKGAMLSHKNIVAAVTAADFRFSIVDTDLHISYLPLAHIFETAVECACFAKGASVGMFQGNVKFLTADLISLRPTILCGVPRVFTKIYQKFFSAVAEYNCIKRFVINRAYSGQCYQIRNGLPRNAGDDNRVFIPLRTKLGLDRTRVVITGAAPCPPYLMEFLRLAIGCDITQGYGMTETAAVIAVMYSHDTKMGHVGPPVVCNEVCLEDVPEMNYGHDNKTNPRTGEICVRGDNIFVGYFKNEEETAKTIVDGWLHTGDIGRWNPNGTLSIIDRRKNIFKISQGEYIAAEKIELIYAKSPAIGQVWVYGNSYKSFILCVVVPNAEYVFNYAKQQKWWPSDEKSNVLGSSEFIQAFDELCSGTHKDDIKKLIFDSMKEQDKGTLHSFEKARDILIESKIDATLSGFTELNNCLTPTFKMRRPNLLNRYAKQLQAVYAKNGEPNAGDEHWPGVKEE